MGTIRFHTQDRTVALSGRARHAMQRIVTNITIGAILARLGDLDNVQKWLVSVLPQKYKNCYETRKMALFDLQGVFNCWEQKLDINGEITIANIVALNTALAIGCDPVKLLARLDGQCEIHCWVDGGNREWLANVIIDGLNKHIYNNEHGWGNVVELLLNEKSSPVVCSYSVTDKFPNFGYIPKNHPESLSEDDFDALPVNEAWDLCMIGLKERESHKLELAPESFSGFSYHEGHSIFTISQSYL